MSVNLGESAVKNLEKLVPPMATRSTTAAAAGVEDGGDTDEKDIHSINQKVSLEMASSDVSWKQLRC